MYPTNNAEIHQKKISDGLPGYYKAKIDFREKALSLLSTGIVKEDLVAFAYQRYGFGDLAVNRLIKILGKRITSTQLKSGREMLFYADKEVSE